MSKLNSAELFIGSLQATYNKEGEGKQGADVTEMIFSGFQYHFANVLTDISRRQNIVSNVK